MSYMISNSRNLLERQLNVMETFSSKDMIIDQMKTEALIDKTKVIKAHEKLLECLDMRLAVEFTVQSSVQQTILIMHQFGANHFDYASFIAYL